MRRITVLVAASLAGCAGSSPMNTDPPPPANGYQIKTPDFTLGAAEEKYLCYAVDLPGDGTQKVAVNEFESFTSNSIHHFEVFQTIAPEPDGLNDCGAQLIKQTWLPLFGGGVAAGGLKLPDGAGFIMKGGQQLLVQLHLLNATMQPVTEHVIVNLSYAADPTTVTPAGIYAFGSMTIDLPPGGMGLSVQSPACPMPKDMNVFAVQPHMHTLGKSIALSTGADVGSMSVAYQRNPWVFGVQPIDTFPMTMSKGTLGQATCIFDNTTSNDVKYGESTKDEMCYFVVFYTPFTGLDGCIN